MKLLLLKDLLESLIDEASLDGENKDAIIHEYSYRIMDSIYEYNENDDVLFPEDYGLEYID
ncbi:MAG: hypothetical protein ACRC0G_08795 [Fusobacteriaceae bacterium]